MGSDNRPQVGRWQALSLLEEMHKQFVKSAIKQNPALAKKLNVVIRDQSIEDALAAVAKPAGIEIKLVAGSVDDARALLAGQTPRISFLDLRRATFAQALDWISQPARMHWSIADNTVTVSTARRADELSAWVYDVSTIALPLADELKEKKGNAELGAGSS